MPLRRPNDVKKIEPGAGAGRTAADTGRDHDNSARTAEARDITALRREMERRDLPAGPPPSFEVSQLEIEADIRQVIARVEAARTQAREADALKAEATAEKRAAEAEMARFAAADPAGAADPITPARAGRPPVAGPVPGTVAGPAIGDA